MIMVSMYRPVASAFWYRTRSSPVGAAGAECAAAAPWLFHPAGDAWSADALAVDSSAGFESPSPAVSAEPSVQSRRTRLKKIDLFEMLHSTNKPTMN